MTEEEKKGEWSFAFGDHVIAEGPVAVIACLVTFGVVIFTVTYLLLGN